MSVRTRRQAILNILLDAKGELVPTPVLAQCSLQYNARIYELRRLGFEIESRPKHVGHEVHGFFRLVSGTDALESVPASRTSTPKKSTPALKIPSKPPRRVEVLPGQLSLFGDQIA